jgi:hypothetical protein
VERKGRQPEELDECGGHDDVSVSVLLGGGNEVVRDHNGDTSASEARKGERETERQRERETERERQRGREREGEKGTRTCDEDWSFGLQKIEPLGLDVEGDDDVEREDG